MGNELNPGSQVATAEPPILDGGGLPPPQPEAEGAPAEVQPGEEGQRVQIPAPVPKTYSEAEHEAERTRLLAERDRQVAAAQAETARLRFETEMRAAQAKDQSDVDLGNLTQQEAEQRQQLRMGTAQLATQYHQLQGALTQVVQQAEPAARLLVAYHEASAVAKAENFNRLELAELLDAMLQEKGVQSKEGYRLAAQQRTLARAKEALQAAKQKTETFDRGPTGGTGVNFEKMTAEQKMDWALAHPEQNERTRKK